MFVFGNISINIEAFKDVTEKEFVEMFKGKTRYDLNTAYVELQDELFKVYLRTEPTVKNGEIKKKKRKKKESLE